MLVIDKTVPDDTYREHKGLMWLLNQQKYVQSNGEPYRLKEDYVGFVPGKRRNTASKNSLLPMTNMMLSMWQIHMVCMKMSIIMRPFQENGLQNYGGMTDEGYRSPAYDGDG